MMKKLYSGVFAICVIGALFLGYNKWYSPGTAGVEAPSPDGESGLEQKVLTFTIDGRSPKGAKQWHLSGNSAEIIEDEIHLKDLQAIAYGDDMTINLTSNSGIYRKDKNEVELIGNVEVSSDDGLVLRTERAKWSQLTKDISSDTFVYIERDGMKATGEGGTANSEKRTARLNKNVTVEIEPNTKVRCDGPLELDAQANLAVFEDNVVVEDKDGRLLSDKLIVNFDPEKKKLSMVTAEGNVKIKKGNSYTISEKAVYKDSTKSAQLLGKPRIVIDPDEISQLDAIGNK